MTWPSRLVLQTWQFQDIVEYLEIRPYLANKHIRYLITWFRHMAETSPASLNLTFNSTNFKNTWFRLACSHAGVRNTTYVLPCTVLSYVYNTDMWCVIPKDFSTPTVQRRSAVKTLSLRIKECSFEDIFIFTWYSVSALVAPVALWQKKCCSYSLRSWNTTYFRYSL